MALRIPPGLSGAGDQPDVEGALPAYNDATGTLDLHQDGLKTQSQVAGQPFALLLCLVSNLLRDQMMGASTYV